VKLAIEKRVNQVNQEINFSGVYFFIIIVVIIIEKYKKRMSVF
jgi:hypothetical protein